MKQLIWVVGFVTLFTFVAVTVDASESSSIEVGFMQDGEPEPRFLVVDEDGQAKLYEVGKEQHDTGKVMPASHYRKRLEQVVSDQRFFSAKQAHPKGRCKDRYILRVRVGSKERERRGCSNQSNDAFAAFSQNMYRDAFQASRGILVNVSTTTAAAEVRTEQAE